MRITGKHITRACLIGIIGLFGAMTYINYKQIREEEKKEADILEGEDAAEKAPTTEVIIKAAKRSVNDIISAPFVDPIGSSVAAGLGLVGGILYKAGLNDGTDILEEKQKSSFAWGYANGGREAFSDIANSCNGNAALKDLLNKNLDKYYEGRGFSFAENLWVDDGTDDKVA